jgi:putative ABC transport system ATP-binding protein
VVLVTHESDIAEYSARVVVMRDGRVRSDHRRTPRAAVPLPPGEEPHEPAHEGVHP